MKHHQTNVLVSQLNKAGKKANAYKRLASELQKPTRQYREVNVSKLQTYSKDGMTLVVPGKVLGTGVVSKPLTVAAFSFTQQAKEKIKQAKGKAITIQELMEKNPQAQKIKIIG